MNDEKCQHDINLLDTSVNLCKRRIMIFPNEFRGNCKFCKKPLVYIKNQNGYVLKEEKKDENF